MLTRMKLENFKAWREADLTFGKVTGFFGANSAGKSSLLHLLLLLKQTRNATDRGVVLDFGGRAELVNLGTFADVVHLHDKDEVIRWLLEWTLPRPLRIPNPMTRSANPLFEGNSLQTRYEVGCGNTSLLPRELAYRFNDVDFLLRLKTIKKRQFELVADPPPFTFIRKQGRAWPLPQPVKTHLFPSQAQSYYQNAGFLGDFELAYENLMDSIYGRWLRASGMPGTGDMFYKHVLNFQYRPDRVRMVAVTPSKDPGRGFEELPENTFDPSDRKFLAVAVVAKAVVLNATDSDWCDHEALMDRLGVEVSQLCPQHASKARRER